ncbi:MAG: ACT domain-containing protein [Planctomycetes bacterium]|nr:ACT domain-containing protein [Planctomycetota bacterium]
MARRYLTADDVRRLAQPGGQLVVDADVLATPHALAAAEELGVRLVTHTGGPYAEPAPDRGPDAERARRSLPNLPEPEDDDPATSVVITAVGRNRPGVLAEITGALAHSGGSVHDISQKMIEGYFHMVLTVELPPGSRFGELKRCLECLGGVDDYVVRVMHERVFRFMHRI